MGCFNGLQQWIADGNYELRPWIAIVNVNDDIDQNGVITSRMLKQNNRIRKANCKTRANTLGEHANAEWKHSDESDHRWSNWFSFTHEFDLNSCVLSADAGVLWGFGWNLLGFLWCKLNNFNLKQVELAVELLKHLTKQSSNRWHQQLCIWMWQKSESEECPLFLDPFHLRIWKIYKP